MFKLQIFYISRIPIAFLNSEIYQRWSRSIKLSRSSYIVVHPHTLNENKFKQQVGYNRIVQRT